MKPEKRPADRDTAAERPAKEESTVKKCPYAKKCGGCSYQGLAYERQLKKKESYIRELAGRYCHVSTIIGMQDPLHYRNKVHHVIARDRRNKVISGFYEPGSHRVVGVDECMIEDELSQRIIRSICELAVSFRIRIYDEDTGFGLLRHVLVRRGFQTGEVMVVLVLAASMLPSKNNFVKALRERHPEITTVVLNVNEEHTSMVLGKRNITLYGPGYIRDTLCGLTYRISADSFYQVNPVQTEILYRTAVEFAGLTGSETVIDAYCGIGTIGMTAAAHAGRVIGVELNKNAVNDAIQNAKDNGLKNVRFYAGDAGEFMEEMAAEGRKANVLFMDPPRSGSTEQFLKAAVQMAPRRIVYISCGPESLARDLAWLTKHGYKAGKIQPVDMFPFTGHTECVVLLSRSGA